MNPITMLENDHQKVSRLFEEHERAAGADGKKAVFDQISDELTVHAELEEQIFYPAVREASPKGDETVQEGYEEHAEVKALLAELSVLEADDEEYVRKFAELRSDVEHHVAEEEGEMLPEAERSLGQDRLQAVGARMQVLRQSLVAGRSGRMGKGANTRARRSAGRSTGRAAAGNGRGRAMAESDERDAMTDDEVMDEGMPTPGSRGETPSSAGGSPPAPAASSGGRTPGGRSRSGGTSRGRTRSAGSRSASGRKTGGRSAAARARGARKTGGRSAAARKTAGRKTGGRKTGGRKTVGRKAGGRSAGTRSGSRSRAGAARKGGARKGGSRSRRGGRSR
jgi:hypothetical protein